MDRFWFGNWSGVGKADRLSDKTGDLNRRRWISMNRLFQLKQNQNYLLLRFMSTKVDEIEIPDRIERGPTDLLKAISSTLTTDYTAPHYRLLKIFILKCKKATGLKFK